MTIASTPPPSAIAGELFFLLAIAYGMKTGHNQRLRGPDALRSARWRGAGAGLIGAAAMVWIVAFVNLGANRVALWAGLAVFLLGVLSVAVGQLYVILERREGNRHRVELRLSRMRWLLPRFVLVWCLFGVIVLGVAFVITVVFVVGGATPESAAAPGAVPVLAGWMAIAFVAGAVIRQVQLRSYRREGERLRAEERDQPLPPQPPAPPWQIAALWVMFTVVFGAIAAAIMLTAGHGASKTRLVLRLDQLGYSVVAVVVAVCGMAGVAHWCWQRRRQCGGNEDGLHAV